MSAWRRLGVRSRVALAAAGAVAVAVVIASVVTYVVVRHDLLGRVDGTMDHRVGVLERRQAKVGPLDALEPATHPTHPTEHLASAPIIAQVVASDGAVVAREASGLHVPVGRNVLAVADGRASPYFADTTVGGTPVRLRVTTFGPGFALELVRPIADLDAELERLAAVLVVTSAAGVLFALVLGAGVAGVALKPVRRLTEAAELVASTRDLAQEIRVEGKDELARLASSINSMLEALDESQRAQRQLVADASHELRTPLTSLRTNVEVMAEAHDLDPAAREQLLADISSEFDALGALLADLVELARQDDPTALGAPKEPVALDSVVVDAVERAARSYPSVNFLVDARPARVWGNAADLARVVANLLSNAGKWSPESAVVEVRCGVGLGVRAASGKEEEGRRDGADQEGTGQHGRVRGAAKEAASDPMAYVLVRDHGPGIDPADLPHVFERFYRGRFGHEVPGSGLGLAIVRRIVDGHGGQVQARLPEGGGTEMVVELPLWSPPQELSDRARLART